MFWELVETCMLVMIVFQVSLKFDPAKEILKMRCQIYILMKKPNLKTCGDKSQEKKLNRSSCSQIFFKIVAIKIFPKFT